MQLQALVEHLVLLLGRPPLDHRAVRRVELAVDEGVDRMLEQRATEQRLGLALGELEARVLEIGERLAEGFALLHIGRRLLDAFFHIGDRRHGHDEAFFRQARHKLIEAASFDAAQAGFPAAPSTSSKNSSDESCALQPIFFRLRAAMKALRLLGLQEEEAHALWRRRRDRSSPRRRSGRRPGRSK